MATLEKIRSKSGLLIVVIGVALLAFIVGDAITNSRNLFGNQSMVAKVGDQKIDYTDYIKKREEINNRFEQARRQNPAQYANFDTQLISQMALDELIGERLLDKASSDAGIRTSAEQLRFFVIDNPINPTIQEIIQQLNASGLAVSTPAQAYEVIFNPKRNGLTEAQMAPFQRVWLSMEEETKQLIKRQQYQALLYGTIKANDLDKKALYDDYTTTSNVEIAFHPFGQLDEKKYAVSEKEIAAAYAEHKNLFKVNEPTKDVKFIAVSISPSVSDREDARLLVAKTVKSLNDSAGQLSRDIKREGVSSTHHELRLSDIPSGDVKEFVATAANNEVKVMSENIKGFSIVKMGKRSFVTDSIQLNLVQVVGNKLPARVLAKLNNEGIPADSLSGIFGADSVMAQTNQWIPLMTAAGRTGALEAGQLDTLINAGGRYVALMESEQGSVLAKVTERKSPVEVVEYDEITYDLKPSTKTVNGEREKLEKFLESNPDAKSFAANAAKAGYSILDLSLSESSPAVPRMAGLNNYYPDSRQVVRWVIMDAKPGQVSHIYESKDAQTPALYAVAVTDEYNDYMPLANTEVNAYAKDRAQRIKAGDELVKQYQPKAGSMASVAQAMDTQVQNDSTFRFGFNGAVRDAAVMGQIAGSKAGKVVVVKGDNGVYAYQVKGNGKESFPFSDQQYEQQYYQLINPNMGEMLKGASKVDNRIYKFEAGD